MGEKNDHWLEFKATVWKGDLKELEMTEYKKEDNSERKKYQREIKEQIEKLESQENKWYAKPYAVYRFCLTNPLRLLRYLIGWTVNLTWKIERWMP